MAKANNPLRKRMTELSLYGTIIISAEAYKGITVRNYASELGREQRKKFTTHFNRAKNRFEITRTA